MGVAIGGSQNIQPFLSAEQNHTARSSIPSLRQSDTHAGDESNRAQLDCFLAIWLDGYVRTSGEHQSIRNLDPVRTTHDIPAAVGLPNEEVKVSRGARARHNGDPVLTRMRGSAPTLGLYRPPAL